MSGSIEEWLNESYSNYGINILDRAFGSIEFILFKIYVRVNKSKSEMSL